MGRAYFIEPIYVMYALLMFTLYVGQFEMEIQWHTAHVEERVGERSEMDGVREKVTNVTSFFFLAHFQVGI